MRAAVALSLILLLLPLAPAPAGETLPLRPASGGAPPEACDPGAPLPAEAARLYALGLALDRSGRHDRAIEAYSRAIAAAGGNHAAAFHRRGIAYGRKGHFDRESTDTSKAFALDPEIETAPRREAAGADDAEIERYTRAIAESPDDAWAHYNRGIALRLKGEPARAVRDFERALALDPGHHWSRFHLGGALRSQGRLAQAIETYERALALDPAPVWALYNRGLIRSRQGLHADAIADFDRVLALDGGDALDMLPDYAWAYFDRGSARLQRREYRQALADFDRAATIAPDFCALGRLRALALCGIGEDAAARAQESGAAASGRPDAWLVLRGERPEREILRLPLAFGEPIHLDYINSLYRMPVRESFRCEPGPGLSLVQVETPSAGVFEFLGLRPETPGRATIRRRLDEIRLLSSDYRDHRLSVGDVPLALRGLVPDGRVLILRVTTDPPAPR